MSELEKIAPIYFEAYLAVGWLGFTGLILAMQCREHGYVSWGGLAGAILLAPLLAIVAPMLVVAVALAFALFSVEKALKWVGAAMAPLFDALRPLGRMFAALAAMVGRKLSVRAFSCTSLQTSEASGSTSPLNTKDGM